MRLTRRRTWILAGAALLAAAVAVTWTACDWPPPRLILKYGLPPTGGPTGQRKTIHGIEFIELGPGYFREGVHEFCDPGDFLGRVSAPLGLKLGHLPHHDPATCVSDWIEIDHSFWIAATEVSQLQYYSLMEPPVHVDEGWPVGGVTPEDAESFCRLLSERSPGTFRLPSESEWAYACLAGRSLSDPSWRDLVDAGPARINHSLLPYYHLPARRAGRPNAWNLIDMIGGVGEWCRPALRRPFKRSGLPKSAASPDDPSAVPVLRFAPVGVLPEFVSERLAHDDRFALWDLRAFMGLRLVWDPPPGN